MAPTPIDVKVRLGMRVQELRRTAGLTQEQLAHGAGLSRPYVGALERGEQGASVDVVERLARALGVPPARLLEDKARYSSNPSREEALGRRIAALARGASAGQVELFERLAHTFFTKTKGPRRGRKRPSGTDPG